MRHTQRNGTRRSRRLAFAAAAGLFAAACGGSESSESAASESDDVAIVIVDTTPAADPGEIVVVESDAAPTAETSSDEDAAVRDAEPTSGASEEELALQFAQCMRDEGVDKWPDPATNADGSIDIFAGGLVGPSGQVRFASDEVQAAIPTCGPIIAGASFLPNNGQGMNTETQDNFLAFAQCLRDEGVDVSDPDLTNGAAGLADWEFDADDPANADAIEACQTAFTGAGGG